MMKRLLKTLLVGATSVSLIACNQGTSETPEVVEQVIPSESSHQIETRIEALPLPNAANGQDINPADGYAIQLLSEGLWLVTDGIYQAMIAEYDKGVVVFDAPPSLGENLKLAISKVSKKPITHLIYSHSHIDHIGGAAEIAKGTKIIASLATAKKLARFPDANRPTPTQTFDEQLNLNLNGLRIEMRDAGIGHEPGNLFIYLPQQKVLMAVDIIFPGWVPFTNLGMAEEIGHYVDHHNELLAYDFDVFVGGHIGRAGTREDVQTQASYIKDLIYYAKEGRETVNIHNVAGITGYDNKWLLVKTYMDQIAAYCAEHMIAKWGDRLGGADVSTPGHCWVMQEYQNINGIPELK